MEIAAVAVACGFASRSHFTNAFKAMYGLAPGQYRQQAAQQKG